MLKKRELTDCHALFELMTHPDVFPFVRHKTTSYEEFLFLTKQTIEAEEQGTLISRTILDEWGAPIGTISLFDIQNQSGFLGTWLGKPFHGKGYNQHAKDLFFAELFFELGIESVLMKIRKHNVRSQKAAEKLPYVSPISEKNRGLIDNDDAFHLYEIHKDLYTFHLFRQNNDSDSSSALLEA